MEVPEVFVREIMKNAIIILKKYPTLGPFRVLPGAQKPRKKILYNPEMEVRRIEFVQKQ